MQSDPDFKRAIEAIKLRAPIEDVVRERVPDLKRSGQRYWACCPFHDESTPSFSVEPRLGLWYCFGACSSGGDQIDFLQRCDHLSFMEAVEILAARTGVELPRGREGRQKRDSDAGFEALAAAERLFVETLRSREGAAARAYLDARGLSDNTVRAFSLGFAPADGRALVALARHGEGFGPADLEATGLVRRDDSGRAYGFFRGRLTIPIRDLRGRTVGFGARRLADGETAGPKYVNTSDTAYFHKGRLIYGLDRALETVRRGGHLVLVEGYTDVMAAHQAGLAQVVAVLGTSTTEEHAALVRRAGARRVTLVFDGDDAGRAAAWKALHGLLPLEVELDVVRLEGGVDPCELLVGTDGAGPFQARLDHATDWFEFVLSSLDGLSRGALARGVDRVLELCTRVAKPVHRETLIARLAGHLALPLESVREQWRSLPERRRAAQRAREAPAPAVAAEPALEPALDPAVRRALRGVVGAVLLDPSLAALVRTLACPEPRLAAVLGAVFDLLDRDEERIDPASVMDALGEHPARAEVAGLIAYAGAAEDPKELLEGEIAFLRRHRLEREKRGLLMQIGAIERSSAGEDDPAVSELLDRLASLHRDLPEPKIH